MDYKQRIKDMLELRFEQEKTLEEISNVYKISRERVRQILVKAIGTTGGALHQGPELIKKCLNCKKVWNAKWALRDIRFCSRKCYSLYKINHRRCRVCRTHIPGIGLNYFCRKCNTDRCRKWRHTENGRKTVNERARKNYLKTARLQNVRVLFNHYLVTGRVKRKMACDKCGSDGDIGNGTKFIDAHHPDYRYPLKVIWLCRACHSKLRKKRNDRTGKRKV